MKLWTKILCGLLLAFIPASRLSFAWMTPVNISNTPGVSNFPTLVADSWGQPHVVWMDNVSGNNEISYSFYNGDHWSAPLNLSNDSTDSERPDITIDASGHPHVAWKDHQSGEIMWTFYDGLFWSSPANISNNPGYSTCPSLAADDSGRVFIAWHDIASQSDIYFNLYNESSWSIPQNLTDDPVSSAYPDIVVDSRGHVHVVWMDYGSLDIHYSEYDGDSWRAPINVSQLVGQSCYPRIALDSQDQPHVIWEERSGGSHIYYTFYDEQFWFLSYKISSGHNPAIIHDGKDHDHVVWGNDYEIHYSFGCYSSWSVPVDISNSPETRCICPDIDIDSIGSLHVVWASWDEQYHSDIFYSSNRLTGVEEQPEGLFAQEYLLEQNYPNPFNLETVVRYSLKGKEPVHVSLRIFNLLGEELVTLIDEEQLPGDYEVVWDGKEKMGKDVSSGIYFYQLKTGTYKSTRKAVLLR